MLFRMFYARLFFVGGVLLCGKFGLEMNNLMKRTETLLREVVDHLERNRNSFGTEVGRQEDEASPGGNSSNSSLTEASVKFR